MDKKTVRDVDVTGKRVLVRVDFNVPFGQNGAIADDTRVRAVLPTIEYLIGKKARIILCSHLGRPDGKVVEKLSLKPVAELLSQLLGSRIEIAGDCIGPHVEEAVSKLKKGEVLMLENLRFHPEEEENDPKFAWALAQLADIHVNDAFGVAHRKHASNVGVAEYLTSVAGLSMEREVDMIGKALEDPARPFTAIIGGAKISDKIGVIENILNRVDSLIIAGGMSSTFLKALRYEVGGSPVETNKVSLAQRLMEKAAAQGVHFLLPTDVVVADKFEAGAKSKTVQITEVPATWYVMDIGPQSTALFEAKLRKSKTVVWNGPVGVFEFPRFANGTKAIAQLLAGLDATTVIGGGSTAEAVHELNLEDRMTHVSTGGGASLRFLEGQPMPGIEVLQDKER